MEFLESDFFKSISAIADVLTLGGLAYAGIYALVNKNKTLIGFTISRYLMNAFKAAILLFVLVGLFQLCDFIYLFSLILFKQDAYSVNHYRWQEGYEIHHIGAYFIFISFFLFISWIIGSLIWTGSPNQAKLLLNLFLPQNKQLSIRHFKTLSIISARYGANNSFIDLTDILRQMIEGNTLKISANNEIAGDPIVGVPKSLIINYRYEGEEAVQLEIPEGQARTILSDQVLLI